MCARDKSAKAVDCEPRIGPWISIAEPNGDPGPRQQFTTAVLGGESSQRDAFVECAMPLLEAALGGQHSIYNLDLLNFILNGSPCIHP